MLINYYVVVLHSVVRVNYVLNILVIYIIFVDRVYVFNTNSSSSGEVSCDLLSEPCDFHTNKCKVR